MITAIHQIAINVKDVQRARGFYRDGLGLAHLFDAGPELAFFDCGGVRLMVGMPTPEFEHASSILYLRVDDIRAEHGAMVARGVRFREEPHIVARLPDREVWLAAFDDGEGNTLALMSESPASK